MQVYQNLGCWFERVENEFKRALDFAREDCFIRSLNVLIVADLKWVDARFFVYRFIITVCMIVVTTCLMIETSYVLVFLREFAKL